VQPRPKKPYLFFGVRINRCAGVGINDHKAIRLTWLNRDIRLDREFLCFKVSLAASAYGFLFHVFSQVKMAARATD